MRSAKEDYTSRNGEDMRKMRMGVLNLIGIVECLKGKLSGWKLTKERGFKGVHL